MANLPRTKAGVPAGGQFAEHSHPDSAIDLNPVASKPGQPPDLSLVRSSGPSAGGMEQDLIHLAEISTRFVETDRDAFGWMHWFPDEMDWESPDCDIMSERFLALAQSEGFDGFLVRADSADEGQHWFAVINCPESGKSVAVDWTARQFYNAGHPAPPTDPELIPCPLVFDWPGQYPLDVVHFETMVAS